MEDEHARTHPPHSQCCEVSKFPHFTHLRPNNDNHSTEFRVNYSLSFFFMALLSLGVSIKKHMWFSLTFFKLYMNYIILYPLTPTPWPASLVQHYVSKMPHIF